MYTADYLIFSYLIIVVLQNIFNPMTMNIFDPMTMNIFDPMTMNIFDHMTDNEHILYIVFLSFTDDFRII